MLIVDLKMLPQSSSSNRSRPKLFAETYHAQGAEIFNNSFYEQRVVGSAQNFQSMQFVRRYLGETGVCQVVEKAVQALLQLDRLPHNPYNLMYRLIHHEAINENMRRHYSQQHERNNLINAYLPIESDNNIDSGQNIQDEEHFVEFKVRERTVYFSEKLSEYINGANLLVFSKLVGAKRIEEWAKAAAQRLNLAEVHQSFGGPLLLNLRGNEGVEVPVKLPKQTAEKSIYCGEAMLNTTFFVLAKRELLKSVADFVDFVLEEIRESMQYKDENHTVYFQRLEVINVDEVFSLMEFSREQLINSATQVRRELLRGLERENLSLRSKCVYRLSRELAGVVGEELVTVSKEYVLVAEQNGLLAPVSNAPLRYLLRQVFLENAVIDLVSGHPDYAGKDLHVEYRREAVFHLMFQLKTQNLAGLVWEVFYYLMYEDRSTTANREFVQDLFQTVSYVLLSPVGFVQQLRHSLRSVKWLTLPSFPTYSENEAYAIIVALERDITAFIQKGDYIYWELQVFYEAIKRLLSIIVEFKQLKLTAISFIVDHALLMLDGVMTNFNQIVIVLQGNISHYVNLMRSSLTQNGSEREILFYEQFLRGKEAPTRVLRVSQEVKKAKKQLSVPETEAKTILLAKYVARYGLYEKVYSFYWTLITGKKVMYPLSGFLKLLMANSTLTSYEFFRENQVRPEYKVERSVVNEVPLFEINHTETATAFYSLHPDALNLYAFKQYKTVLQIVEPFLDQGAGENGLGFRYGSSKTGSSNSRPDGRDRRILSLKSVEMGASGVQQGGSASVSKVFVDVVVGRALSSKGQLYSYILDTLNTLMEALDKQNFSVLGLFAYSENQEEAGGFEERLYSKLLSEDNLIRYDYKKKLQLERLVKFIEGNVAQGRLMELRAIYTVRQVTKLIKLSPNFYYRNALSQNNTQFISLFKMHFLTQRVFPSKKDILGWCELNGFKRVREMAGQEGAGETMVGSLKRLQEEREVRIEEILSEREGFEEGGKVGSLGYFRQSPFYNILRKVGETMEVLSGVVEYLKVDRRGRFEVVHLRSLLQLVRYYLLERCVVRDDYVYSQGVSVSMTNLLALLSQYVENHPDNCGEERELLQFERVARKLADLVRFAEISCSICIKQSLELTQKQTHELKQKQ